MSDQPDSQLLAAIKAGDLSAVKRLIADGVDLEARDVDGRTACALAAYHNHITIVEYLIEAGADVNAVDNRGRTVLMQVNQSNQLLIELLKNAGAQASPLGRLISANNRFGLKLFQHLIKSAEQNIFLSPFSIINALAVAFNGAAGATRSEMASVMEIYELDELELNQAMQQLAQLLMNQANIELTSINLLCVRTGVELLDSYFNKIKEYLRADKLVLDFQAQLSREMINKLVSEQTCGRINEVINNSINEQVLLLIINACYFKAEWQQKFQAVFTKDEPFYLLDGREKILPMMELYSEFNYFADERMQLLELPYRNGTVSIYLLLPRVTNGLAEVLSSLTPMQWANCLEELQKCEGSLTLPRFRLEYDAEITETLKSLGLSRAFDQTQANFSRMVALENYPENILLNGVLHRTFLDVNEEGTTAAAATISALELGSPYNSLEPFQMTVDHPFCCIIQENDSGAILFIGAVIEPE